MNTAEIVLVIVLFALSALLVLLGVRQLQCKGYCFNNAYIYASKKEREQTDFTPYYKQSGKVFLMLSALFALNAMRVIIKADFLIYVSVAAMAGIIVYAIASSVRIEKNK